MMHFLSICFLFGSKYCWRFSDHILNHFSCCLYYNEKYSYFSVAFEELFCWFGLGVYKLPIFKTLIFFKTIIRKV